MEILEMQNSILILQLFLVKCFSNNPIIVIHKKDDSIIRFKYIVYIYEFSLITLYWIQYLYDI